MSKTVGRPHFNSFYFEHREREIDAIKTLANYYVKVEPQMAEFMSLVRSLNRCIPVKPIGSLTLSRAVTMVG